MTEIEFTSYDAKTQLLLVLKGMDIEVLSDEDKYVKTIGQYTVEVERKSLYKLYHEGLVIAPFDDVVELCFFIKNNL